MGHSDCWRAETWSFVREHVPAAPARVVEVGCGPEGGLVPHLLDAGYDAMGIDPAAPDGERYVPTALEDADVRGAVDAVVASVSLHHVDDLDRALDRIAEVLAPSGTVVIVEWAWERFDAATARWCFDRLAPPDAGSHAGWLGHGRERWVASGLPWDAYLQQWATTEGLHPATDIVDALDKRFTRVSLDDAPYFFCDLVDTSREEERAAIDTGLIRATCLRYVAISA